MKSDKKLTRVRGGVLASASLAALAFGLNLAPGSAGAQQYQSTYGTSGGSVVIDPNVLNSMGGTQVTTQGTAIIPIPGTGATLLAPPLQKPRSRLLVGDAGTAPAQTGAVPAQEPASRLLVAPATQAPATGTAPTQPRPSMRPAQKIASVSDETPPPPKPTALKESEPVAPEPMQADVPQQPPRTTAVEEEAKAEASAPPAAAPDPAPSPGADTATSEKPEMAEEKPAAVEQPMAEDETAAEEKPMAAASEPDAASVPQTPSVAAAPASNGGDDQTASLPPSGEDIDERLLFDGEQDEIDDGMRSQLQQIAETLLGNEARRIELRGYADAAGGNAGAARRVSLKRAVSVRRFLMDQGVRSTRIDVRALGDKDEDGGPPDRVDLILSQ